MLAIEKSQIVEKWQRKINKLRQKIIEQQPQNKNIRAEEKTIIKIEIIQRPTYTLFIKINKTITNTNRNFIPRLVNKTIKININRIRQIIWFTGC